MHGQLNVEAARPPGGGLVVLVVYAITLYPHVQPNSSYSDDGFLLHSAFDVAAAAVSSIRIGGLLMAQWRQLQSGPTAERQSVLQ